MAATKEEICIAQHLKAYVEQCKYREIASFAEPCEGCPLNKECDFEAYQIMGPFVEKAGVEFTPSSPDEFKNRLQRKVHKMQGQINELGEEKGRLMFSSRLDILDRMNIHN
ncbi:hypothetical protein AJ85_10515 [Alkalihalobacillus alcalophilus ATCC 27647 = CGMCC 1.3604]|uniref:Uncharacterized protein n=1 Tax=Alkalihalobacillus alcalophilus ATCC 27647 = CGMCC 1.3604 TaxID=1218173 RepID=A0A094WHS2_ALKAL|nr:hypothetical protein [Alkalihalobacillus alcalophilus]YP_009276809.1 hypothetical protein BH791_gp03 [Bacillus phage BalMu-1]AJA42381.1 hypothetical protein BalMu1_B3 [Bacillus phage BalMu-1]AJA42437.1 hypothetical protein BalMu1_A3 [Bacillus phage BalMu-1]KGA95458.1 hypothetical protein BALCAV_0222615 [Alkalihalobacillus alcalophilus ATCC 27647 = CGMCC 1.3604]MED1561234.1 hypothetical protein [Alkalihalobacillus alcalophilus]THG90477.1 hypothetical protein AJ85_10515 [Alkalihalobacillus a